MNSESPPGALAQPRVRHSFARDVGDSGSLRSRADAGPVALQVVRCCQEVPTQKDDQCENNFTRLTRTPTTPEMVPRRATAVCGTFSTRVRSGSRSAIWLYCTIAIGTTRPKPPIATENATLHFSHSACDSALSAYRQSASPAN